MNKIVLSSIMLFSAATYADTTPTFDFSTGVLAMPFISTAQGNFNVSLKLDPTPPGNRFTIIGINPATAINDAPPPPTFDFGTNTLSLPKINTSQGVFTATLQLSQNAFQLTSVSAVQSGGGTQTNCTIFPANNFWNTRIDNLPVHPFNTTWINSIAANGIRSDFGAEYDGGPFGQPINFVSGSQTPKVTFNFQIPGESDAGPYPVPTSPLLERTSEPRLLIIDNESCNLYEVYNAVKTGNQWSGRRGAIWNMHSNALRPLGFGSADDGGFATVPGLVRYDEVAAGAINHALRFTFPKSNTAIWPARHVTGTYDPNIANKIPMGARLRLKASFNIGGFDPQLQVILQAMKTYGIILTDDGTALTLSGTPDSRWDNDLLGNLRRVKGSDFEAVSSECMMVNPDSGEANPGQC